MRLTAILALSLLLPSLSVANWTDSGGTTRLNTAVATDVQAIKRGGSITVDLADSSIELIPWADGSGDRLTLTPVLPGLSLSTTPTGESGWTTNLSNGTTLEIGDLQTDKSAMLDGFGAPGVLLAYTIAVGDISFDVDDYWRPKTFQVSGNPEDFVFLVQTDDSALGSVQAPCIPGSIAIYHATKRDGSLYTTGKVAHIAGPTLEYLDIAGQVVGTARGTLEYDGTAYTITKAYHRDAVEPVPPTAVSARVGAELGYTTKGASSLALGWWYTYGPITATSGGSVDSFTVWESITGTRTAGTDDISIYWHDDNAAAPNSRLHNQVVSSTALTTGDYQTEWAMTGAPGIVTGSIYWLGIRYNSVPATGVYYDATGSAFRDFSVWNAGVSPDPWTSTSALSFTISMWITYTEPPVHVGIIGGGFGGQIIGGGE